MVNDLVSAFHVLEGDGMRLAEQIPDTISSFHGQGFLLLPFPPDLWGANPRQADGDILTPKWVNIRQILLSGRPRKTPLPAPEW